MLMIWISTPLKHYTSICPYESNTIKILDKSKQGPVIHNVENSIIQLTNYYGIVYNKFKCEYYT